MNKSKNWTSESKKTITNIKRSLGNLAEQVRTDQFKLFEKLTKPTKNDKVIDVGVASSEDIKSTNLFEKKYPFSGKLTAATIEDKNKLQKLYPKIKVVKISPGKKLSFENNYFKIATSWATLEHVGNYKKQENFINELLRVGSKIFITTPYRGCIYEPHSGLLFVHWLPLLWFRKICKAFGKNFWSTSENLNPLYVRDIRKMKLIKKVKIKVYKMFSIIPSHLIIYSI